MRRCSLTLLLPLSQNSRLPLAHTDSAPSLPPAQLTATNPRNREGVRYATRAVLLLSDYLRAVGQHADANWALMKAHFQVGVWGWVWEWGCRV